MYRNNRYFNNVAVANPFTQIIRDKLSLQLYRVLVGSVSQSLLVPVFLTVP